VVITRTQKHPIRISYPTNTGFWLYDFWVFILKSFMTTWPRLHKWLSSPVPYMTPVTVTIPTKFTFNKFRKFLHSVRHEYRGHKTFEYEYSKIVQSEPCICWIWNCNRMFLSTSTNSYLECFIIVMSGLTPSCFGSIVCQSFCYFILICT
jgi:hypothetical protein